MIEEIKKIIHDPKIIFLNQKKYHYKPVRIGNAFSRNYIEYKSIWR